MKNTAIALAAIAAAALTPGPPAAKAGTLDDVKARGVLNCIVSTGLAGFSFTDNTQKKSINTVKTIQFSTILLPKSETPNHTASHQTIPLYRTIENLFKICLVPIIHDSHRI